MDKDYLRQVEEIYDAAYKLCMRLGRLEIEHTLFTWRWWLLLILAVLPWVIWLKIRRRESTDRLLYAGLTAGLIALCFDFLGMTFGLWLYNVSLIPSTPPLIPWDLCLLPFFIMVFIQFKQQVKPFIKAVVFSAFGSFFWQPFGVWIGVYNPKGWHHYYSFPIFIGIYLIANHMYSRNNFAK